MVFAAWRSIPPPIISQRASVRTRRASITLNRLRYELFYRWAWNIKKMTVLAPADSAKSLRFMNVDFVNRAKSVSPNQTKKRALCGSKMQGYWLSVSVPLRPAQASKTNLRHDVGRLGMSDVIGLHFSAIKDKEA